MVAKTLTQLERVEGAICPKCRQHLVGPSLLPETVISRYQITMRTYFGWCFDCQTGVSVMQFKTRTGWLIYQWYPYLLDVNSAPIATSKWIRENELPVAPVVLGAGATYDNSVLQPGTC